MSKELNFLLELKHLYKETRNHQIIDESAKKYFDTFEQALKRNEPMKVIRDSPKIKPSFESSEYLCPNCHHETFVSHQNYCDVCGQKLDWSDKK